MVDDRLDDRQADAARPAWDSSTHENFYQYYARQSVTREARDRSRSVRDIVLAVAVARRRAGDSPLAVADIGCGPGVLSMSWAELGHRVYSVDISAQFVALARQRARAAGLDIGFCVGTATELPWRSNSMDVCLMPELLEHIGAWRSCLKECARVLRPGGVLFVSTNNKLCPVQQEFNLPLYSWYPGFLKRYYERLAVTTRADLANYAKYPAVNWFTFYSLRAALAEHGFVSFDRFDAAALRGGAGLARKWLLSVIRYVGIVRWLAHVATPYTLLVAVKGSKEGRGEDCEGAAA